MMTKLPVPDHAARQLVPASGRAHPPSRRRVDTLNDRSLLEPDTAAAMVLCPATR